MFAIEFEVELGAGEETALEIELFTWRLLSSSICDLIWTEQLSE